MGNFTTTAPSASNHFGTSVEAIRWALISTRTPIAEVEIGDHLSVR